MSERASAGIHKRGTLISTYKDSDKVEISDTVKCVHCGRIGVYRKGTGKHLGFCTQCNGVTCPSDACQVCVPELQLLENIEQGRPLDYRPICISTAGLALPGKDGG